MMVFLVAAALAVSAGLSLAADDLRVETQAAAGQPTDGSGSFVGSGLAAQLAADVPAADFQARFDRANALGHRADRIRELMAVACVLGLMIMLLTVSNRAAPSDATPVANTTRNGSV
jgi:hypothetical protein